VHRVEAARRNARKPIGGGALAIFAIDVEQLADAWGDFGLRRQPYAAEAMGERIAHAGKAFGAESGDRFQTAVVRGRFEVGECFEAEFVMQSLGEDAPDARHRGEEGHGIRLPPQPIEHRQTAMDEQLANCARDAFADARQFT
jgi:hypothetical protein